MHICIYTSTHVHINRQLASDMYLRVCVCMYACVCVCMHMCVYQAVWCTPLDTDCFTHTSFTYIFTKSHSHSYRMTDFSCVKRVQYAVKRIANFEKIRRQCR